MSNQGHHPLQQHAATQPRRLSKTPASPKPAAVTNHVSTHRKKLMVHKQASHPSSHSAPPAHLFDEQHRQRHLCYLLGEGAGVALQRLAQTARQLCAARQGKASCASAARVRLTSMPLNRICMLSGKVLVLHRSASLLWPFNQSGGSQRLDQPWCLRRVKPLQPDPSLPPATPCTLPLPA